MRWTKQNRAGGPIGDRPRSWGSLALVVLLAAITGPVVAVAASTGPAPHASSYLAGSFGPGTVHRFAKDLASVGIGVYAPAGGSPLQAVRAPVSPMRLTADQARAAALGVWSHAGLSGASLDALAPPLRLTPKLALPIGAIVAGWAKQVQSPSAALARRILGKPDWRHYRRVVLPQAVLVLFASDVAVHLAGRQVHGRRPASALRGASAGPCSAVQSFIDQTIGAVFNAIGHVAPPTGTGFFAQLATGAAFVVNTAINVTHFIVIGGVKVAIGLITSSVAAVAGTVTVVSQIATALLPWTGTIEGSPNPISKGVGSGVPGELLLNVTAPGSNLEWPRFVVDCAQVFNIPLPTLKPSNADVEWDVSNQDPPGLLVRKSDSGPLDRNGRASLRFETTSETPELAKGDLHIGAVVAIATIHRKDVDQLADRLSHALLGSLPKIVKSTIGPVLQAKLKPLLDAATAKIATVRDIQATGVEAVRYHVPKEQTAKKGSGFSLTTGSPTVNFGCTGEHCDEIEQLVRNAAASERIQGRTCSGPIESTWHGTATSPPIRRSITFVVPSIGKTGRLSLPDFVLRLPNGSETVRSTIERTGERTVVFRAHLVGDLTIAPNTWHIVEDVAWVGTIVPATC
jgi:hypothetical protein